VTSVFWTRLAIDDLAAIHRFIAGNDRHAADRVQDRVTARVAQLGRHPRIGRPGRVPETRELTVSGFPYVVVYRVPDAAEVHVLRVLHSARKYP
jgi:plasmid stabilization system protein ParE